MNRHHYRTRPAAPLPPPSVLLAPCECSHHRGPACITCRRWQLVFDKITARRALWAALAGGTAE